MTTETCTVRTLERSYVVRFTPEMFLMLAAGVLFLIVLAFFLGRRAEVMHQRLWGPAVSRSAPGQGRPEPLPELKIAGREKIARAQQPARTP